MTTSEPESTGNPGTAGRGFGGDASAGVTVAESRASGRTDRIRTAHLPALEALEAGGQAGRGTYARPWAPGSPSLAMSSRAKRSRVSRSTMSTVEETTQDT